MPTQYEVYPEHVLVIGSVWGPVDAQTLRALVTGCRDATDCDPAYDILIDLSGVTEIRLSFADMQSFVDLHNKRLTDRHLGARTALLAPADKCYGFARMYVSISAEVSPRRVAAYRSIAEVLTYLGRSRDPRVASRTAP